MDLKRKSTRRRIPGRPKPSAPTAGVLPSKRRYDKKKGSAA